MAMAQSPSSSYKSKATPAESQPLLSADHLFLLPGLSAPFMGSSHVRATNYKKSSPGFMRLNSKQVSSTSIPAQLCSSHFRPTGYAHKLKLL